MNDYQSNPSAENLMLDALCEMLPVAGLNRTYFCFDTYYSGNEDSMETMLKALAGFTFNQLNAFQRENTKHLAPKKFVDLCLAAAVASWLQITRYVTVIGQESEEMDAVRTLIMTDACADILEIYNPAFQLEYDEHLSQFGVALGILEVLAILKTNNTSLLISGFTDTFWSVAIKSTLANFTNAVYGLRENCQLMQAHLAAARPPSQETRSGDHFVRTRYGKAHYYCMELAAFDFQFRRMSFCYVHKIKGDKSVKKSDPLHKEWWKATDLYLNMVRRGIKEANEEASVDWYCVAQLNRQLLTAMLSGVAKTVSFQEIEKVTNEMKAAAEKCKEWAPSDWKTDIEDYCLLVEGKVLPFLKQVNPSATAPIDVFTPEFLNISEKVVDCYGGSEKTCAACDKSPVHLMKCGGVS